MPRCCGTINDPADATSVLVYVEVNAGDSDAETKAGLDAAEQAAQGAFVAIKGGTAPPVNTFTRPGRLTTANLP
ncbi:MAG: hypothetical protein JO168_18055 [Solirubrobacterales bacterium]|nr:hypothetical protein [Solirubrobacterales bacterium]MBV9714261.1 hypothetical protein [Solirubrobacterales bacterium]